MPVAPGAQGNANPYALRKGRKDRPDLHERVLTEELTPHPLLSPEQLLPEPLGVFFGRGC